MKKHDTPMLDELESGPWPSFVSGIKRLRDGHPDERVNDVANDLLGQLQHSYETRKGYWKGGTVSIYGYGGGIIPRFSESRPKANPIPNSDSENLPIKIPARTGPAKPTN